MREQAKVLAARETFQRLVANPAPVRVLAQRRELPEDPVGIEGCQQLRVLEVLPAGLLVGDWRFEIFYDRIQPSCTRSDIYCEMPDDAAAAPA